VALLLALAGPGLACSSTEATKNHGACTPDDADGIIDEPSPLLLVVTDAEFRPRILATQNSSEVTLTLDNQGTRAHRFVVDCKPTPNADGCPAESCFPSEATVGPVGPGERTTVVFVSPLVEGIYDFRSDLAQDTELAPGQFIIQ